MKNSIPILSVGIALLAIKCIAVETSKPDCLGIRPGMTVTEAGERLKNYNPKLDVQSVHLQIPQLSEKPLLGTLMVNRTPDDPRQGNMPMETFQASITLPPNAPVVWKVFRFMWFEPGHEPTKSALLTALSEKYGKESLTVSNAFAIYRYWMRGTNGTLLEGQSAKQCSTFYQAVYSSSSGLASLAGC